MAETLYSDISTTVTSSRGQSRHSRVLTSLNTTANSLRTCLLIRGLSCHYNECFSMKKITILKKNKFQYWHSSCNSFIQIKYTCILYNCVQLLLIRFQVNLQNTSLSNWVCIHVITYNLWKITLRSHIYITSNVKHFFHLQEPAFWRRRISFGEGIKLKYAVNTITLIAIENGF